MKKGQSKDPPQGETLGALDTFNIQEKRYCFLGLNEQARKFGLKTVKPRQISGKTENYSLSTQQQLDLELPLLLLKASWIVSTLKFYTKIPRGMKFL